MLRQVKSLAKGAVFRWAYGIKSPRSVLAELARKRRHVRRRLRRYWSTNEGTGWVLLSFVTAVFLGLLVAHF